jgi:hypothetical protein
MTIGIFKEWLAKYFCDKDTQNMIKFEKYVIFIFSNLSVLAVDIFFY